MKKIGEYHDPGFYFQELVRKQVEREAWIDWAKTETPKHVIVPPLTPTKGLGETALHVIYSSVRGFIHP